MILNYFKLEDHHEMTLLLARQQNRMKLFLNKHLLVLTKKFFNFIDIPLHVL